MYFNLLASNYFSTLGNTLENFLSEWWGVLMGVVAAMAGILAVMAGVKYMLATKEGDEQKVKQAKNFVVGIVIAIVIMALGAVLLPILIAALSSWVSDNNNTAYAVLNYLTV